MIMSFIEDKQLIEDAESLGFDGQELTLLSEVGTQIIPFDRECGYTLEQLEKWLFSEHEITIDTSTYFEPWGWKLDVWDKQTYLPIHEDNGNSLWNDPFTARLEGVKKAVEYLKSKGKE